MNKSRRIGFSEVTSFRRAAKALGLRLTTGGWADVRPANQNLLSASYDQSKALLQRVMRHVDAMVAGRLVDVKAEQRSTTQCTLSNGMVIKALSTNPRTARGYEGDVLLDEWASAPHQEQLWAAVAPLADKTLGNPDGYEIDVVSTPLGDADMFYAMVEGDLSANFSKHVISVHDAMAQGFPLTDEDIAAKRLEYDEEMFAQEFECSFIAANTRYISREIYDAAAYYEDEENPFDPVRVSLAAFSEYAGIDVARKRDLFALCRLAKHRESGVAWHRGTEALRNPAGGWDELERWTDERIRPCSIVAVDSTSIGSQFTERLANRFGGKIEAIDFTPDVKEELATGMKLGLQRKRLRPRADDSDTRREVLSMRKEVTKQNNIRYDIPTDAKTKSHGDKAWAMALAFKATGTATRTTHKPVAQSSATVPVRSPASAVRPKRRAWQ